MPAATSLSAAARPSSVYATGIKTASAAVDWVRLTDIKQRLHLGLEDIDSDSMLIKALAEAIGYLEKATGRNFSGWERVAEFTGASRGCRVLNLEIPQATIVAVEEVDGSGGVTVVPSSAYEVLYENDAPLVRLTRDSDFSPHADVWARITFTATLVATSPEAQVARGCVYAMVEQAYNGMAEGRDCRASASFKRAIASLRDFSATSRALRQP